MKNLECKMILGFVFSSIKLLNFLIFHAYSYKSCMLAQAMYFTCLLVIGSENKYSDIYPGSVRYHMTKRKRHCLKVISVLHKLLHYWQWTFLATKRRKKIA